MFLDSQPIIKIKHSKSVTDSSLFSTKCSEYCKVTTICVKVRKTVNFTEAPMASKTKMRRRTNGDRSFIKRRNHYYLRQFIEGKAMFDTRRARRPMALSSRFQSSQCVTRLFCERQLTFLYVEITVSI